MKILHIGPDLSKSRGGMVSVISEIIEDTHLNEKFHMDIYSSYISGIFFVRLFYSMFSFLKFYFSKQKYDIYHIHAASRGSIFRKGLYVRTAKKWGKKVILHIHSGIFIDYYKNLTDKRKALVKNILEMSDQVIVLSEGWKRAFVKEFGLRNCQVLRNCVDLDKFEGAVSDPKLHNHSFGVLAKIGPEKGIYDLIDATELAKKKIPDIKIFLAGEGETDNVKNLARRKNLEDNIHVVGWVDFEKKIALLKKVATVVLPSYSEGLPMAILEGMACGKAIISTFVGAIPEVVGDTNGTLISPGDVKALSDALIEYATNPDKLERVSIENISKIRDEYSIEKRNQILSGYYEQVALL